MILSIALVKNAYEKRYCVKSKRSKALKKLQFWTNMYISGSYACLSTIKYQKQTSNGLL